MLRCAVCLVCVAAAVPAAPARPLTQEQAVDMALETNASLARTALEVQRQELAARAARESVRGVRIRPGGAASASTDGTVTEFGMRAEQPMAWGADLSAGVSTRRISFPDAPDITDARVQIEIAQPLFRRFGRRVRDAPLDEADERLRAERRRWTQQQIDLAVEVVRLYEEMKWTVRRIETDHEFAGRIEALHALAEARERQGQAGRLDVLKMELQLGEAHLRLRAGEDRLEVLRMEFCERIGVPLHSIFELVPAPLPAAPDLSAAEAIAVAYGWRMDYAQALDDLRSQERRLDLARRGLLPDVVLRAGYARSETGERWREALGVRDDAWTLGLGVDLDLRQADARLVVAGAEIERDVQHRRLELERTRIARDVHARLLAHRRALAELNIADRNRRLATDRADLARTLYRAGRGDAFTVSDAEDAFLRAELAWLAHRRDVAVSAHELLQATGTLMDTPADLRPDAPGEESP